MEISLIITNYNCGKYIARAIRSAISQSFNKDEFEIIVVDDASTDDSRNIITLFSKHIKQIFNKKNLGIAKSCNTAIKSALGRYVVRLDADDYIHKDLLKIQQLFLSLNRPNKNVSEPMNAVSCDYYEVDEQENVLRRRSGTTFPIACGVMFKTDDMLSLGLYDETIPREDEEFRHRFLKSGKHIYNISVPLYRYTQYPDSITKSTL